MSRSPAGALFGIAPTRCSYAAIGCRRTYALDACVRAAIARLHSWLADWLAGLEFGRRAHTATRRWRCCARWLRRAPWCPRSMPRTGEPPLRPRAHILAHRTAQPRIAAAPCDDDPRQRNAARRPVEHCRQRVGFGFGFGFGYGARPRRRRSYAFFKAYTGRLNSLSKKYVEQWETGARWPSCGVKGDSQAHRLVPPAASCALQPALPPKP